jgi:GntR family transcriptional regulator
MRPHSARLFSIAAGSSEPIYRQLVAQALALNPMTVSKAYGMLETEGVLSRRRGIGMVVAAAPTRAHSVAARAELLRPTLQRAALEARQLELDPDTVLALFTQIMKAAS